MPKSWNHPSFVIISPTLVIDTSIFTHEYSNMKIQKFDFINPFSPSVPIWNRLAKLSILILEGIIRKISYERLDYESV